MLLNNVRSLRRSLGVSRTTLAKYLGCNDVTVYYWENQYVQPKAYHIYKLLVFFDCSFDDLFSVY